MIRVCVLVLLSLIVPISVNASSEEYRHFGEWSVVVEVDEFEGERKPILTSDVHSSNGELIGSIKISSFLKSQGQFHSAFVSIDVKGLDDTFPECDYEFLKYKIDSSESDYFPNYGYACPILQLRKEMAAKFSTGSVFRFSASEKVGVVSLKGFKGAWDYSLAQLKKNKI